MATQKAQTAGFLPGEDPETLEANRRYQEALNKLTQSLDVRKNRFFDPVWLAAAQGFASAKTPDFFESLGPVAKNIAEAQSAQEKEGRDIAQMQLDVAGRGLEMQRQKSLQALAARQMQGRQAGEPSGAPQEGQRGFQIAPPDPNRMTGEQYYALAVARGVPPDEAMKGAAQIDKDNMQARESGAFNLREGRFYPSQYKEVPFQIDGKTYNIPEGVALELSHLARIGDEPGFRAAAQKAIRNFQRPPAAQGQVAQSPVAQIPAAQPASLPSAAALPAPPALAAPVPAAVPQPAAALPAKVVPSSPSAPSAVVKPVPPAQAGAQAGSTPFNPARLPPVASEQVSEPQAAAPAARPPAALPVAPQVAQAAPAAVQPAVPAAVPPAAPARTTGLRSQEDIDAEKRRIEIEQATAKARAEAEVKSEIETKAEISANAKRAREVTATANILRRISDRPDFSKMSGILSNDLFSSAMAMLARDGIGGKNISIGIPAIEDVMRNRRLNPEQQSQYRIFLMYASRMNLAAEDAMKGSTTERERLLLGNATISNQDTKETVRMKADLLNIKAQFDKRVANAFEDSKMTPKEFFRSKAYDDMYTNYLEGMEGVASGMMMLPSRGGAQPGAQRQGAPAQGRANGSVSAAGNRLRELVKPPQQRRP
jgi:hypothetical protein